MAKLSPISFGSFKLITSVLLIVTLNVIQAY
jgi:hypothetical protein